MEGNADGCYELMKVMADFFLSRVFGKARQAPHLDNHTTNNKVAKAHNYHLAKA